MSPSIAKDTTRMVKKTETGRAYGLAIDHVAVSEATAVHLAAIASRSGASGPFHDWARVLADITGTMHQELLAWNQDLVAENSIPKGSS
jgi:hypothetical protein